MHGTARQSAQETPASGGSKRDGAPAVRWISVAAPVDPSVTGRRLSGDPSVTGRRPSVTGPKPRWHRTATEALPSPASRNTGPPIALRCRPAPEFAGRRRPARRHDRAVLPAKTHPPTASRTREDPPTDRIDPPGLQRPPHAQTTRHPHPSSAFENESSSTSTPSRRGINHLAARAVSRSGLGLPGGGGRPRHRGAVRRARALRPRRHGCAFASGAVRSRASPLLRSRAPAAGCRP